MYIIKWGITLGFLCGQFLVSIATCNGSSFPLLFTAKYNVFYLFGGNPVLVADIEQMVTRQADESFQFSTNLHAIGFAKIIRNETIEEKSTWVLASDRLRPVYYSYKRQSKKKNQSVNIEFDWQSQQIRILSGDVRKQISWSSEHILDRLLFQLSISYDLQRGTLPIKYNIADKKGELKTYFIEQLGEELIDSKLGLLKTKKIMVHSGDKDKHTTFWCAEKINFLPIKVEHVEKGKTSKILIESYQPEAIRNKKIT